MISVSPLRQLPAEQMTSPEVVVLDFAGTFSEGSHAGAAFSGRIHYDRATPPTERHMSFAMYDQWRAPIVTIAVDGHILTGDGAAVYDGIFDGCGGHYDFVTMHGSGWFGQPEDSAYFEFFFADADASTLDGSQLPSAAQLTGFPVKQLTFGTDVPGNVISVGTFTVSRAR